MRLPTEARRPISRAGPGRIRGIAAIAALVFAACGPSAASPTAPLATSTPGSGTPAATAATGPTGTLTIALADSPQSLDPLQAWNSYTDIISLGTYDALVQYGAGSPAELQPWLAEKWSASSDGMEYTFTLRSGVVFHDGSSLTAADVKYTLDRVKRLNSGVAYEIPAYDSSEVVGDLEIKVRLSAPYAPFVAGLSRIYILNSKLLQANEGTDDGQSWLALNEAGSGPYALESYTAGDSTVLKAYPGYWRGWDGSHVQTVVLKVMRESATQLLALQGGDAQVALDIAKADLDGLKSGGEFTVNTTDTLLQFYVAFNTKSKGPTGDVRFREALSWAYDYRSHIEQVLGGYAAGAQGPLPKAIPCHKDDVTQPTFDLQKARELLVAAGYDPSTITLKMAFDPSIEEHRKSLELFQSSLRDIGITVDAAPLQFTPYVETLRSYDTTLDLASIYEFSDFPDPHAVLYPHFGSAFLLGNGGYNWSQYSNPRVDELLDQGVGLSDLTARCPIYDEVQEIIANDYPVINISNGGLFAVVVTGPTVAGYKYNLAHHRTVNYYDMTVSQ